MSTLDSPEPNTKQSCSSTSGGGDPAGGGDTAGGSRQFS